MTCARFPSYVSEGKLASPNLGTLAGREGKYVHVYAYVYLYVYVYVTCMYIC